MGQINHTIIHSNGFTNDVNCPTVHSPAEAFSVIVDFIGLSVLAFVFSRKVAGIQEWRSQTVGLWLILAIYTTSWTFIFSSSFIKNAFGLNGRPLACSTAATLCVVVYFGSKVCIYFFLVERAYLVRATGTRRFKDKVWVFNTCGMLLPYTAVAVVAIIYHAGRIQPDGRCHLLLYPVSDIAVMTLDIGVSIYLTALFLIPLMSSYSFKRNKSPRLRRLAKRTLVGCIGTLLPTIANMSVMLGLKGEWGWICLMTCNLDILFSALVLHWVTSRDSNESPVCSTLCSRCRSAGGDNSSSNPPSAETRIYNISRAANSDEEAINPDARIDSTLTYPKMSAARSEAPNGSNTSDDKKSAVLQMDCSLSRESTLRSIETVEMSDWGVINDSYEELRRYSSSARTV